LADLRNSGGFLIGIAQSRQLAAFISQLVTTIIRRAPSAPFRCSLVQAKPETAPLLPPSAPAWDSQCLDFRRLGHIAGQGKMLLAEFSGQRLEGIGIGGAGAYCPVCGAEATGKTELPPGYSRQMLAERAGTL
jgi:hypothetical protein